MDMVDGALKMSDVGVFKRGTFGLNRVRLRDVQSFLLTQIRGVGPVSFNYFVYADFSIEHS